MYHTAMAAAPSREPTNVGRPRAEPGDPLGHIETEMLVFVRNLEAQARRTDLFRDMDRAGYCSRARSRSRDR